MLRRLVVAALAAVLVLGVTPARASAASDDWRPLDDHYRCIWHCRERARLFRTSPKPVPSKAAPAPTSGAGKKGTVVSQKGGAVPATKPAGEIRLGDRDRVDRGSGFGIGPFSWLTSLFGNKSWRSSTRSGDRRWDGGTYRNDGWGWGGRSGRDDWTYRNDGWGWGGRRGGDDWGYHDDGWGWGDRWRRDDGWGWGDRWRLDDGWGWDDWHHGWNRWPRYRDNWGWDDGRDSGYTAHRHHPRGGDY